MVIVVMGVSGTGKSVIGAILAKAMDAAFLEGDDFHPASNVRKMASGIALTDGDRVPWLSLISAELGRRGRAGSVVVSCSALKRSYRQSLREGSGRDDISFVHLKVERSVLERRLEARSDHYMPVSLLRSQLELLEEPSPPERFIAVENDACPEAVVQRILERLEIRPQAVEGGQVG